MPEQEEGRKTSPDETLRTFNLAFLNYAGYTQSEIANLGDLSKLTEDKMTKLIRDKGMVAVAEALKREMEKGNLKFEILHKEKSETDSKGQR